MNIMFNYEFPKNRIFYLNQLRALKIIVIGVVFLSSIILSNLFANSINFSVSDVFYSLCIFYVPVFLILFGIFLLNKKYTFLDFIKKRFLEVFLTFLFCYFTYVLISLSLLTNGGYFSSIESIFRILSDSYSAIKWITFIPLFFLSLSCLLPANLNRISFMKKFLGVH